MKRFFQIVGFPVRLVAGLLLVITCFPAMLIYLALVPTKAGRYSLWEFKDAHEAFTWLWSGE